MNNADKQYFDLLRNILKTGADKTDRTGTGTLSIFDYSMRFNMQEGFPLLTSKKMAWKSMVIELLWFLRGDTNIKWLVENGCMIWVGDAYKNYTNYMKKNPMETRWHKILSVTNNGYSAGASGRMFTREEFIEEIKTNEDFAKKWGELGPVYGAQWRKWKAGRREGHMGNPDYDIYVDQITDLIKNLKENPDSRRLMVNAWNVAELDNMVLPPCHYGFQCYTRELSSKERVELFNKKINSTENILPILSETLEFHNIPKRALSLKWTQRSVDTFLGLPFNISSYGLLLTLLSREVNMIPEDLIFSGGDVHIYTNHIDQCKQQLKQKTFKLPTVEIADKSIFDLQYADIKLVNYESAPIIKGELSN